MFYFDKHDKRVTFCDNREIETTLCDGRKFEVHPDCQTDFTKLPFEENSFRMVVFDPPHLIGESKGWQKIKYGYLDKENWRETIEKGFSECFRVLEPGGFLIFKWNETNISVKDILECTQQKTVFGHKSGKQSNTHWICFMKEEKAD